MADVAARHEKLREKLASRCQPYLPPGSVVRHVFLTQTGPNPFWLMVTFWIVPLTKYWMVCVTDDAIYVLRSSVGAKPKELAGTLPRDHQLGPVSGVWAKIELLGARHWVHKRFHKVVQAADAERGASS
jgi:hypothetical protein